MNKFVAIGAVGALVASGMHAAEVQEHNNQVHNIQLALSEEDVGTLNQAYPGQAFNTDLADFKFKLESDGSCAVDATDSTEFAVVFFDERALVYCRNRRSIVSKVDKAETHQIRRAVSLGPSVLCTPKGMESAKLAIMKAYQICKKSVD